jgi:phosphoglycolate phosphatase-like HAD superfamily hydrolase
MSPMERAALLMTLMRELEGVMRAEGALLREMRLDRLQALQEEKSALADAFEAELRRLRGAPEAVAALAPEARAELDEAMRRFRAAARANGRQLEAGRRVVEGVVRVLGDSLAGARGAGPSYRAGATPAQRRAGAPGAGSVVSLALDRQV